MNHINMNIKSAYSITNTLVSESKKYITPSRLGVENNDETDFLKRNVISMVKMKKLNFKKECRITKLEVNCDPPSCN